MKSIFRSIIKTRESTGAVNRPISRAASVKPLVMNCPVKWGVLHILTAVDVYD